MKATAPSSPNEPVPDPTLAMYLLKAQQHGDVRSRNPFIRLQQSFEHGFERLRLAYQCLLTMLVHRRSISIPVFLLSCLSAFLLVPWLGQDFFPTTDSGQFILHVRAKSGTRIEETARLVDLAEDSIRRAIPPEELDNISLPYSAINWMHSTSGFIGAADADILVSLKESHHPTADYVRELRKHLPAAFPGTTFYFLPADMVTQILNFGLPAPVVTLLAGYHHMGLAIAMLAGTVLGAISICLALLAGPETKGTRFDPDLVVD